MRATAQPGFWFRSQAPEVIMPRHAGSRRFQLRAPDSGGTICGRRAVAPVSITGNFSTLD